MFDALIGVFYGGVFVPFLAAALAGLVAILAPTRLKRARDCVTTTPLNAGVMGALTLGACIVITWLYQISLVFIIPLILLPVVLVFGIAIGVALFLGWVVIADIAGRVLLARIHLYAAPVISTVVGAFALSVAWRLLAWMPCIGGLVSLASVLLAAVGLGSLVLTRGGLRGYPPARIQPII